MSQEILRKAIEFRASGVYDGEISDVVMKICANIIKIPITVVTSNQSILYIPFLPEAVLSSEPIYVAFHFYGDGHYDAIDPMHGMLHLQFFYFQKFSNGMSREVVFCLV